jgi:hypothetical protein
MRRWKRMARGPTVPAVRVSALSSEHWCSGALRASGAVHTPLTPCREDLFLAFFLERLPLAALRTARTVQQVSR